MLENSFRPQFHIEFPRSLVCTVLLLENCSLTLTSPRFAFSGGSNVTLEGSVDPYSGWVHSYGQKVESTLLTANIRVLK